MTLPPSADLLQGAASIGNFLDMTPRRVHYLIDQMKLPVFKIGGRLCARRSTLTEWIAKQEREAPVAKGSLTEGASEKGKAHE